HRLLPEVSAGAGPPFANGPRRTPRPAERIFAFDSGESAQAQSGIPVERGPVAGRRYRDCFRRTDHIEPKVGATLVFWPGDTLVSLYDPHGTCHNTQTSGDGPVVRIGAQPGADTH